MRPRRGRDRDKRIAPPPSVGDAPVRSRRAPPRPPRPTHRVRRRWARRRSLRIGTLDGRMARRRAIRGNTASPGRAVHARDLSRRRLGPRSHALDERAPGLCCWCRSRRHRRLATSATADRGPVVVRRAVRIVFVVVGLAVAAYGVANLTGEIVPPWWAPEPPPSDRMSASDSRFDPPEDPAPTDHQLGVNYSRALVVFGLSLGIWAGVCRQRRSVRSPSSARAAARTPERRPD